MTTIVGSIRTLRLYVQFPPHLFAHWDERAHAFVAQEEWRPDEEGDVNRKQRVAEQRIAGTELAGDCAPQVSGQQDRAKDRSAWDEICDQAKQLDDPDDEHCALRISELNGRLYRDRQPQQFHDQIKQQKENDQSSDDACGPELAG